jgi:hypothetical protein
MKLVYWVAECLNDSHVYSIRERTRRACIEQLKKAGAFCASPPNYGTPHKVVVEYDSAFDLLTKCLSEGGIAEHFDGDDSSSYHHNEQENDE